MAAALPSGSNTDTKYKLLTVMQQIQKLKEWHAMQRERYLQKNITEEDSLWDLNVSFSKSNQDISNDARSIQNNQESPKYTICNKSSNRIILDEEPIAASNKSFEMLLNDQLSNEVEHNKASNSQCGNKPKFKFLKRGQGLARFRMKPDDLKLHGKSRFHHDTLAKKLLGSNNSIDVCSNLNDSVKLVAAAETVIHREQDASNQQLQHSPAINTNKCKLRDSMIDDEAVANSCKTYPELLEEPTFSLQTENHDETRIRKEFSELKMFEMLEQCANDSNISCTSSVMMRLMDESFQSTPVKSNGFGAASCVSSNQTCQIKYKDEYYENEYIGVRKLDIIDEEPSKLESTIIGQTTHRSMQTTTTTNDSKINDKFDSGFLTIINQNGNYGGGSKLCDDYYEEEVDFGVARIIAPSSSCAGGSCCTCSECSCCEENSHFVSASVSLVTEEKYIYSPLKKFACCTSNCTNKNKNYGKDDTNDQSDLKMKADSSNFQRSIDLKITEDLSVLEDNKDNEVLKLLLRARLEELEKEVEAFKTENAHLNKIRNDYEAEYKTFTMEKTAFFRKLTEERNQQMQTFANEKKKFLREKQVYEKCLKDTKNLPTKGEREEIKLLKAEITALKEQMNQKESRWGAAQARLRTQMKQLENQNIKLTEEIAKLQLTTSKKIALPVSSKRRTTSNANHTKNRFNCKRSSLDANQEESVLRIDSKIADNDGNTDGLCLEINKLYDSYNDQQQHYINPLEEYDGYLEEIVESRNAIQSAQNKHTMQLKPNVTATELNHPNGSREKIYSDGKKEVWFSNGNVKKISADGNIVKTIYFNGDVKETLKQDGIVKYYYASTKTWHTTYNKNGCEIIEFLNGQIEKHHPDGTNEIRYTNGTFAVMSPDGVEKWTHKDGTIVINDKVNDEKLIILPNQQREIHTKDLKRREYPDGTVKIVYRDGTQETRYFNGRIRLKNKDGLLISDSETNPLT